MKNIKYNHRPKRKSAKALLLSGMLTVLALSAWAQDGAPDKNRDPEARQKRLQEKFDEMVSSIPNLTEDQKTQIYTIHNKYRAAAKEKSAEWKDHKKSPEEMENMSKEEKEALIDKRAQARAEMQKQRLAEREEMKQVLSKEQIDFLKERRKREKANRPKRSRSKAR